jgi:DNA-binding NtrC family response regulator
MKNSENSSSSGSRMATVLIVEDEPVIRLALSDHLQEANFKVFEARSTKEAIEILEAPDRIVDLVFVDVQLPGVINGLGLATWVKGKRPGIRVVLTSGYPEKAKSAHELFENAPFVQKPYDFAQVVKTLRAALAA